MTSDLPPGRIKVRPEDFVVDEIAAYEPSGAGEHVFVRITKRAVSTPEAARAIAQALGCDPRATGFAGMKDRWAIATQTISLLAPRGVDPDGLARRARELALEGIVVQGAKPHGHKLKPGHLKGNRFTIMIRELPRHRIGEVLRALDRIAQLGVPNAFGEQRFGRSGDNALRALSWLRGEERGPRDRRLQRLLWSSLQSAVFNEVLDARVRQGTWATPLEGDLLKLRLSGGLFECTHASQDLERAARGEVSPTGPIVGARMRRPRGLPDELEQRALRLVLGESFDLQSTRHLGEGSRRALRMWVQDIRCEVVDDPTEHGGAGIRVYFVLPKGGYATTVLRAAVALDETAAVVGSEPGDPDENQE